MLDKSAIVSSSTENASFSNYKAAYQYFGFLEPAPDIQPELRPNGQHLAKILLIGTWNCGKVRSKTYFSASISPATHPIFEEHSCSKDGFYD
jgi:hypothetical protein